MFRINNRFASALTVKTTAFVIGLLLCSSASCVSAATAQPRVVAANDPHIQYSGRTEGLGTKEVTLGYSGARIRLRFKGTDVAMRLQDSSGDNYALIWIDGEPNEKVRLDAEDGYYPLAKNLSDGIHTVEVVRVTEGYLGLTHFEGFELNEDAKALGWPQEPDRNIEFIGDSITCGYGVEADSPDMHFDPATENFCLGYSGLAARMLNADYLVVSRSGIGMVRNYDGPRDGSENTMPDIYPHTFYLQEGHEWDSDRFKPDVVCINLGTNDFSTTGVNVGKFTDTYTRFASMILSRYSDTQLVIIQGPMNNSEELRNALKEVVGCLKKDDPNRVHFLELSAQGELGFGADYHPNQAQSQLNARELASFLSELMDWE